MVRRSRPASDEVIERAEFVGRTVKELCDLLRTGASYPEISERIERSRESLQSIRTALWQRELVRTLGQGRRRAA